MRIWRYGRAIETLGQRYRLEGVLGSGGMADVCLAWDERNQREVAIKVIKPDELDQRTLNRFLQEAGHVARWRHPHILRVYGPARLELLDPARGTVVPYIVMEYAEGGDLHKRMTPGEPYPLAETLTIFVQLCRAVSFAHSQGVIHRDLKPLNILFRRLPLPADASTHRRYNTLPADREQVVLSDFGLAVEADATHFTFAGAGTLPYMAPEQLQGRVQSASDIFALGVILYVLCTGRLPFRRSLVDLRRAAEGPQPLPPSACRLNPHLPPQLDEVLLTALAEDPSARFPDALDLWQAVYETFADQPHLLALLGGPTDPFMSDVQAPGSAFYDDDDADAHGGTFTGLDRSDLSPFASQATNRQIPDPDHSHRRGTRSSLPPASPLHPSLLPVAGADLDVYAASHHQTDPFAGLDSEPVSFTYERADARRADELWPAADAVQDEIPARSSRASRSRRTNPPVDSGSVDRESMPRLPSNPPARRKPARSRRRRWWLIALTAVVLLSLGLTYVYFYLPGLGSSAAIITIVPVSQQGSDTFTFSTTPGTLADLPHDKVSSRELTVTITSETVDVKGTGKKHAPGDVATGTLTFFNGAFVVQKVPAGTILTGGSGVQIVTDIDANIPAADAEASEDGTLNVPAHAVDVGGKGNIVALDINKTCCIDNATIFVRNVAAFTGGKDAQDYSYIQQSDVDKVAEPLQASQEQQGKQRVSQQKKEGEELAGEVACQSDVQVDQPVGDQGREIGETNVSVVTTCRAIAYDDQALQDAAVARLKKGVISEAEAGSYRLTTSTHHVKVRSGNESALSLDVTVTGTWIYTLSDREKNDLISQVAGLSPNEAIQKLKGQKGIENVFISDDGLQAGRLPEDVGKIRVVVQDG